MLLRLSFFPPGKDFAVTFVDDTDLSTRANTQPVYECLAKLGIRGTKTVWVSRQKRNSTYRTELETRVESGIFSGSTLEDPEYRDWICRLQSEGFEIALHGVAAGNSYRQEILDGLDRFREILGRDPDINVFHERNIENLYCGRDKLDIPVFRWLERLTDRSDYQGHVEGSPYFWGDIARARIKYTRLPFHTIRQVNTLRWNPSMPFHDRRRPYVNQWFASSDGSDCRRYCRLLSSDNIDRLARERGACIVYTHFAKGFTRKSGDRYELDTVFVETLRSLAARRNAWFPTASELLDRLQAMRALRTEQAADAFTILNSAPETVNDVTILGGPETVLTEDNGDRFRADVDGRIPVGDVAAGSARRFACNHPLRTGTGRNRKSDIIRRERAVLEILNYLGLIRD